MTEAAPDPAATRPAGDDDDRRYLVYRYGGHGLGHDLTAILNMARAAAQTGRVFALDMSRFRYCSGDRHRQFLENFGIVLPPWVETLYDLDAVRRLYQVADRHESPPYAGDPRRDRPERVVIYTSNAEAQVHHVGNKQEFQPCRVEPRGPLATAIAANLIQKEPGTATIGLYFRSGNGEFLDLRFDRLSLPDYETRYEETLARYADAARLLALRFAGKAVRFYVASDSAPFIARMREVLGEVTTLPDAGFHVPFGHHIESFAGDIKPLADAMADIENLSRCDFLVYSGSLFPNFALLNGAAMHAGNCYEVTLTSMASATAPLPRAKRDAYIERAYRRAGYFDFYPRQSILRFHERLLREDGHAAEAARQGARAAQLGGMHAARAVTQARILFVQGDFAGAEAALAAEPALADGGNAYLLEFQAIIRASAGDRESAYRILYRAAAEHPNIPDPQATLLRLLLAGGRPAEAAAFAREAVERFPTDSELRGLRGAALGALHGERGLVNVGAGKPCVQSGTSRWSLERDAEGATNGIFVREYNFNTGHSETPWWMIDLTAEETVRRVTIYNRDHGDYEHLTEGLQLQASDDGQSWRVLAVAGPRFTGLRGGEPWDVWLDPALRARYLRLFLPRQGILHLQQVEIYAERALPARGASPPAALGELAN